MHVYVYDTKRHVCGLQVYSGYRIALRARELAVPIAILSIGATRADKLAQLKVSSRCGHLLQRLHQKLSARTGS